jgi:hypothetical protein
LVLVYRVQLEQAVPIKLQQLPLAREM